jgi:hypothetical protein
MVALRGGESRDLTPLTNINTLIFALTHTGADRGIRM